MRKALRPTRILACALLLALFTCALPGCTHAQGFDPHDSLARRLDSEGSLTLESGLTCTVSLSLDEYRENTPRAGRIEILSPDTVSGIVFTCHEDGSTEITYAGKDYPSFPTDALASYLALFSPGFTVSHATEEANGEHFPILSLADGRMIYLDPEGKTVHRITHNGLTYTVSWMEIR